MNQNQPANNHAAASADDSPKTWHHIVVNNDLEEQADEFYFRNSTPAFRTPEAQRPTVRRSR